MVWGGVGVAGLKAISRNGSDEVEDLAARLAATEAALAEEIRRSRALNRIAEAIGFEVDLEALIQTLTDGGVELTGAQFGAFFHKVIDAEGEHFLLYALSGAPREAFANFPMPRNTALFAPTFSGQGVVRSDDITQDPRYGRSAPHHGMPAGHLPVRSYLAVPVATRDGAVLGGLFFGHGETGRFDARAESLVVGLAAQGAVALESVKAASLAGVELAHRRDTEERLKFALEAGRLGSWELDVATRDYIASDICKANYGRAQHETFTFADLVETVHPGDRARMTAAIEDAIRHGSNYDIEYRAVLPSGETRWVHARGRAAQTGEHGGARRMAGVSLDVTERKRAEERQRLLVNELNHRVKNTLVSVQSIATQTLRTTPTPEAFRAAFEGRILALSHTHDLLTQQNWEGASLREVFDFELEAFAARERIDFDYAQDLLLSPKATVSLGMAVHELATNALKYGALSTPGGRVKVSWKAEGDLTGDLVLTWTERGGPPVRPPTRRGFGARLLERGLAGELAAQVDLSYDSLGVTCTMRLPIRALEP
ncbi:MAG: GAF domain-containing protein [Caulobacter sp.]|nr:GAF domain-containing protein [Caulobacter sp.]